MNNFYWLVKREFWEHRGGFLWAPMITAGIVVVINVLMVIAGEVLGNRHFNNHLWTQIANASPDDLRKAGFMLDFTALMPGGIVAIVLFFVLMSYCMKTLGSDRRDRSILFWKSLPVSDLTMVISKAFSAVVVAPVIATIVAIIGAILMYLLFATTAAFHGVNFGEVLWTLPHPVRLIVALITQLPIYMIWMLPCVGWLMLCSAWSKGHAARWVFGLPFGIGAIVAWLGLLNSAFAWSGWYFSHIALRIAFSVLPGSWMWMSGGHGGFPVFTFNSDNGWQAPPGMHGLGGFLAQNIGAQYQLLATPQFLWGILTGLVMLAIAVWLRRWRTEL